VIYVQYTNPACYPPLEHSSRLLAEKGWQVLFLGAPISGVDSLRFPEHVGIHVRLFGRRPSGWRQKFYYLAYGVWVLAWVVWWRPHCVYASDYLSAPLAWVLSFFPGLQVVYHEHDTPPGSGGGRFTRLCLAARRWLARRAEVNVIPSPERAERFAREVSGGRPVLCVWNCPSREEVSPPRARLDGKELWVYYHGSIVPPQLPASVLHALALLPASVKLRVAGYETQGHRGYVQELRELAERLGIADRVEWLGAAPTRGELFRRCTASDVGVALFPADWHQQMAGASNKPFDYLACGLALVVSDLPDWRAIFVDAGCALPCDPADSQGIADALRWYLDHPRETRAFGEQGRLRVASEWNYEAQFAPVLNFLESRVSGRDT
jgi:glycosyltransferase involved in cell wall biosynthesis